MGLGLGLGLGLASLGLLELLEMLGLGKRLQLLAAPVDCCCPAAQRAGRWLQTARWLPGWG